MGQLQGGTMMSMMSAGRKRAVAASKRANEPKRVVSTRLGHMCVFFIYIVFSSLLTINLGAYTCNYKCGT